MVALPCKTDLIINLTGQNNHPAIVIGRVIKALERGGRNDLVEEFRKEALAADNYDHFMMFVKSYVEVV